jgi:serine/threonine protein kinase
VLTKINLNSSGGSYRQVYTSQIPEDGSDTSQVVFKTFYYDAKFNYEDFEFMRMDALVAEKFASNPRIVNIYGYCALGMINEIMDHGDLEKVAVPRQGRIGHKLPIGKESEPHNTLPPLTKLKYSLDMVEAVVLLHGYHGGVIVHDDIQLSQFLLDSNGNLQLNDFNRAEIMFWNENDKEYCKYRNNPGHGDVSKSAKKKPASVNDNETFNVALLGFSSCFLTNFPFFYCCFVLFDYHSGYVTTVACTTRIFRCTIR